MFKGQKQPFANIDAVLLALHLDAVACGGIEEVHGERGGAGEFGQGLLQAGAEGLRERRGVKIDREALHQLLGDVAEHVYLLDFEVERRGFTGCDLVPFKVVTGSDFTLDEELRMQAHEGQVALIFGTKQRQFERAAVVFQQHTCARLAGLGDQFLHVRDDAGDGRPGPSSSAEPDG